ncbi:MAG: ATP-binding protein [bacterium]
MKKNILLSILIFVGIITIYLIAEQQIINFVNSETIARGKILVNNFTYNAQTPLNKKDDISLYFLISQIMKNNDVIYAKIIDNTNTIVATNNSDELNKKYICPKKKLDNNTFTLKKSLIDCAEIIKNENEKIGEIHIGISNVNIVKNIKNHRKKNISILFIFYILGAFIVLILSKFFKISKLRKKIPLIVSKGHFGYKIAIYSHAKTNKENNLFKQINYHLKEKIKTLSNEKIEKILIYLQNEKQFLNLDEKIELNLSLMNLNESIEKNIQLFDTEIVKKNIHLSFYLTPDLEEILVDENKINSAFQKLISNAFYFLSVKQDLTISTEYKTKEFVNIKLSYTGKGIKKKYINEIFNPDFFIGTYNLGLDLFIIYRIIEAHEGSIEIESNYQKGTTFEIILPIKKLK